MKLKQFLKTRDKKTYIRSGIILGAGAVLFILAEIQQMCLGQNYFEVIVDNKVIGATSAELNTKELLQNCRRNIYEKTGSIVCLDADVKVQKGNNLFTPLVSKADIMKVLSEKLEQKLKDTGEQAYTVRINGFSASFATLDEVSEFLMSVKQSYDPNNQFIVSYETDEDHGSETFYAVLKNTKDTSTTIPQQDETAKGAVAGASGIQAKLLSGTGKGRTTAGATAAMADLLDYAMDHPGENHYETGLIDLGFSQNVLLYTNYVQASELTDVATAVEEVTKEKETNKIYEVEPGDCLSTIAEANQTTVDNIMALNGFSNANAYIGIGDKLIVSVPQPDLSIWVKQGEVYEEDYTADPTIVGNDAWYTSEQVVLMEGVPGHREVNAIVTYENGVETDRSIAHQKIMVPSTPAVVEQGTQIAPTYVKPVNGGRFTSGFGKRWGRMHKGVDWACPTGTTVFASSEGVVEYADWSSGYGYNVIIDHPDGRKTRYAHLSKTLVTAGEAVTQGQKIALSGSTGHSTGPHVHFEIFINGSQVNPLDYIN